MDTSKAPTSKAVVSPLEEITIDMLRETASDVIPHQRSRIETFPRIPQNLFEINSKAYQPRYVSLGPLHYVGSGFNGAKDVNILAMEGNKRQSMLRLFDTTEDPSETLSSCKDFMQNNIDRIYGCYYREHEVSSELVGRIVLIDVCFLLNFFLQMRTCSNGFRKMDYSIFWSLQEDAILLENQLPMFLISGLLEIVEPDRPKRECDRLRMHLNMLELVRLTPDARFNRDDLCIEIDINHLHLLHFVTRWHLSVVDSTGANLQPNSSKSPRCIQLRSATQLHTAGVTFRMVNSSKLLALDFVNGVFYIPALVIHDSTDKLLINLLAHEHLSPDSTTEHLASYVLLMMHLVETKEDLRLLERAGIIVNELGSMEDGSKIFHNISKHVISLHTFSFYRLCREVESFANSRPRRYMIALKMGHFRNPWTVLSLLAAVILLTLTFLQTIYTIKSYIYQKNH